MAVVHAGYRPRATKKPRRKLRGFFSFMVAAAAQPGLQKLTGRQSVQACWWVLAAVFTRPPQALQLVVEKPPNTFVDWKLEGRNVKVSSVSVASFTQVQPAKTARPVIDLVS